MRLLSVSSILVILLAAPAGAHSQERVVQVRFHGNYSVTDDEMAAMAGIAHPDAPGKVSIDDIRERLQRSGRFEWVRVEKRYASMNDLEQVVLLVTVREKPPVKSKFMLAPILGLNDEYGFTYGLRVTAIDLLGLDERFSLPLSWGGERQFAVESYFDVPGPVVDSLATYSGINRKKNPHYDIGDFRGEIRGKAVRQLRPFQLEFSGGWSSVDFGSIHQDFAAVGASLALDTRKNVILPRDAVYAGFGWEKMAVVRGIDANRFKIDLRGYKGLWGKPVLAAQVLWHVADDSLPPYQKPFLGGAATLRGYQAGEFIGDNLFISSLELRVPFGSPRAIYRAGLDVFFDTGAVYDHGRSLTSADFKHGAGLGLYFFLAGLGIKADFAYDLHDSFRVHFSTGFRF